MYAFVCCLLFVFHNGLLSYGLYVITFVVYVLLHMVCCVVVGLFAEPCQGVYYYTIYIYI